MSKEPMYPHVTRSQRVSQGDIDSGDSPFYPGTIIRRGSNSAMLRLVQRLRNTGAKIVACGVELDALAHDFEAMEDRTVSGFCKLAADEAREHAKTMNDMADIIQKKYGE